MTFARIIWKRNNKGHLIRHVYHPAPLPPIEAKTIAHHDRINSANQFADTIRVPLSIAKLSRVDSISEPARPVFKSSYSRPITADEMLRLAAVDRIRQVHRAMIRSGKWIER